MTPTSRPAWRRRATVTAATLSLAAAGLIATQPAIALAETPTDSPTDLVMTIGATQADRMFAWYTTTNAAQYLQYAEGSGPLGAQATTVETTSDGTTSSGEFNHRATVTGLKPSTTYTYRVGSDATGWSDAHTFTTPSTSPDYSFLFFGDPQVGASGNLPHDEAGWIDTITVGLQAFPQTEMLFSAGDQVQHAPNEDEYAAFLAPKQLREIPLVPINGNHDVGSPAYNQHFTVPNFDPNAGAAVKEGTSGGDYYFVYKDTLYVVLNSNSRDYASHNAFMEKAIAQYGDKVKWRILAFHHSIYSVASHVYDDDIIDRREQMPAKISELGFDAVLMGHDHSYTRSYLISAGKRADMSEAQGAKEVFAKKGDVLYLTANSASGSKYYAIKDPTAWYASVINQEKVRNYTDIEVRDCTLTMTTLRSEAHGDAQPVNSVVDQVTLHSSADRCQPVPPKPGEDGQGGDTAPKSHDPSDGTTDPGATKRPTTTGDTAAPHNQPQAAGGHAKRSGGLASTGSIAAPMAALSLMTVVAGGSVLTLRRRRS